MPTMKPDDELTNRLRDAMRRQRPWQPARFFLISLALAALMALPLWWFWSRPKPLELLVIGFDQIAQPDKPIKVRAATELNQPSETNSPIGGREVFFQEISRPGDPVAKPLAVRTDERGMAETAWATKETGAILEIEAAYVDEKMRPPWFDRSRVRVFVWPHETRLLVLDVEPTLKNANDWPALGKALTDAGIAGWRVVYLAANADSPRAYAILRGWVMEHIMSAEHALPNGPVLARLKLFNGESEPAARKAVLTSLKSDFGGPVLYVTVNPALQLQAVATTGDFTGDPIPIPAWTDLQGKLPK